MSYKDCRIEQSAHGRYYLANADDPDLAWNGHEWVAHADGLPACGNWVLNYETFLAAAAGAIAHRLTILPH